MMLPIVSWRVWMTDGTIYESTTHSWSDVPETGVAALCFYHDPGPYRTVAYGVDNYSLAMLRSGFDPFPPDGDQEKLGEWMSDTEWETFRQSIHDDWSRP